MAVQRTHNSSVAGSNPAGPTGRIRMIIKEVSFLRALVSHFSFVTGIQAALAGKPEEKTIQVNVILDAKIYEGVKVVNPAMPSTFQPAYNQGKQCNVLSGSLGQCTDLLSFISGTYDSKRLSEQKHPDGFVPPTEFTIETWEASKDDIYEWQMKKNTTYSGVKWLDAAHTGDGGDRMCGGIATFTYEEKNEVDVNIGEFVKMPGTKYPHFELRRILQQNMAGPKHPASYLG